MHLANLNVGLALTIVERRSAGVVVNKWKEYHELQNRMKEMVKYVFGKKNKARFEDYRSALKVVKQEVSCIDLPNETRVAGVVNLMKDCLRSMNAMVYYSEKNPGFNEKVLDRQEWKTIAQIEGVLAESAKFCFTTQSNRPETAGETILQLLHLKQMYDTQKVYNIVNVSSSEEWPATKPFGDLPRVQMATDEETSQEKSIR
jgi:IS1 family transposase